MRLTIINQFYRPDVSPTAQLSASLADHRARIGDDVTVVTSSGGYVAGGVPKDATGDADPTASAVDRTPNVRRMWTPRLGKATLVKRLIDYASFYLAASCQLLTMPRQDVIVSLTTPPYIALTALLHKLFHRRTKLVLWNMDCYPDVVERANIIRKGGVLSRVLRLTNRLLYRKVDHLVCLDTAMVDLLMSQYAPSPERPPATIIPNWEDASFFPADAPKQTWPEAAALDLQGKFVVLYLGNTGVGHTFETVLEAAEQLRGTNVRFLFVGGGSRWKQIEQTKRERLLDNVLLHTYVPKEQTPAVMNTAQVALITLRDDALGIMSPSKLHSNLAMALPVVYVGPAGSNVDDAITRFDCGVSLRAGQTQALVDQLTALAADAERTATLRRNARAAFDAAYCDLRTLPQFDALLSLLVNPSVDAPLARTALQEANP
ncbi:MAG TPA: glycosyltransferase family 4 protein [Tepidisphaeraceae bacterium]|jgi:glycosyltransferase involved in cell wall biosynthesis|nr:glycosyltransferase family 4 protein [Tepidisphaeraceae bacterium]